MAELGDPQLTVVKIGAVSGRDTPTHGPRENIPRQKDVSRL